jgi:hypothetical protein
MLAIKRQSDLKRTPSPVFSSNEISSSTRVLENLPNSPPKIQMDNIEKMTDLTMLSVLESKYDEFLDKNSQILLLLCLDNLIDEYIEIRNALTIRVSKLNREIQAREHFIKLKESLKKEHTEIEKIQEKYIKYKDTFQSFLPEEIQLTQQQIMHGYIPYPNEPKEFKCGCLSIKYYSECSCKKHYDYCENTMCNEKTYPLIKLYSYCDYHKRLKIRLNILEEETEKVRKELLAIKRQSNSLDYEDHKNILTKNKKRRISRFPWKNI